MNRNRLGIGIGIGIANISNSPVGANNYIAISYGVPKGTHRE